MTIHNMTVQHKGETVWEGACNDTGEALELWAATQGFRTFYEMYKEKPFHQGEIQVSYLSKSTGTPSFEAERERLEKDKAKEKAEK